MDKNLIIVLVSSTMMLAGVFISAFYGYRGQKENAKSSAIVMSRKADESLVQQLRIEISELKQEVKDIHLKLASCETARDLLHEENIMLLRKLVNKD